MKISQAILPVAGFGTRFLPWTKAVPKELLPIGNVPIIGLLVDECLSIGIKDICFVISKGKEAIPQYFSTQPALESQLEARGKLHLLEELKKYHDVRLHVVYQEEMKGDGHAILQAKDWVESDTLAILFGDDLIAGPKTGLQQLQAAYEKLPQGSALLSLQDVPREDTKKYGIAELMPDDHANERMHRVKGLVEKPEPKDAPSTFGVIGKYLIPKSTMDALAKIGKGSKDGEVRLIDGFISQLSDISVYGYVMDGIRYDTGTPEGYKQAVAALG